MGLYVYMTDLGFERFLIPEKSHFSVALCMRTCINKSIYILECQNQINQTRKAYGSKIVPVQVILDYLFAQYSKKWVAHMGRNVAF